IFVNGRRWSDPVLPGTFASLRRKWKNGDRVELDLPMRMRLETLNSQNPETVALLRGPLVLFAVTKSQPQVTRKQLLNATNAVAGKWQVATASVPITMLPVTAVDEAP